MTPEFYLEANLKDCAYYVKTLVAQRHNPIPNLISMDNLPESIKYLQTVNIWNLWEPLNLYTKSLSHLLCLVDKLKALDTNPNVEFDLDTCTEEYLAYYLTTEQAKVLYSFIRMLQNADSE